MEEKYLQLLWSKKAFAKNRFKTTCGQEVEVLNFGEWNTLNGPDFLMGAVRYQDLVFHGHIEFHIQSSDWYLHQHDQDENYQNVILHVVLKKDREVWVQGEKLLTIEIESEIDPYDYANYTRNSSVSSFIPCEKLISPMLINDRIQLHILHQKYHRKISDFQHGNDLLYALFCSAFGRKYNADFFNEVYQHISSDELLSLQYQFPKFEQFITDRILTPSITKGFYPKGNPNLRLQQMLFAAPYFLRDEYWLNLELSQLVSYFKIVLHPSPILFTAAFLNHLLINVVAPFLYFKSKQINQHEYETKAFNLLRALAPEKNQIVEHWKKLGIFVHSSLDSQFLIELYSHHCKMKSCMHCLIGKQILNQ